MMWEDMLLDRDVSDVALAQGVAGVFAIPTDAVAVVGDIEDTLKTTLTNIQILVVRAPAEVAGPADRGRRVLRAAQRVRVADAA